MTNTPTLHEYAARKAVDALRRGAAYEVFVKCAGYLMGEYGKLLQDISTMEQFTLLQERFIMATSETKVIMYMASSQSP